MILYYTGTGNSRFAARRLADALGDELHDLNRDLKSGHPRSFRTGDGSPWVFVSPTYAWQLPRLVRDYLSQCQWNGSEDAWFVLTCGDSVGNAAHYLRQLCRRMGLRFRGLLPLVMPENYIAMFPVPDASQAHDIIENAIPLIDAAAEQIRANADFPALRPTPLARLLSGPVNGLFYPLFVNARAFRVKANCIGCGRCARLCPTNTIRFEDGKPTWDEGCTHCMACISACPEQAIEYGKASLGKPRHYLDEGPAHPD